jgi:hypothetical protein
MAISNSAMLCTLNISIWTARKLDKKVSQDVDTANSTMTKAGNYHKNLLAGDDSLTKIQKIASEARTYHARYTSPWNDNGQRLLTTAYFLEYKRAMGDYEKRFWDEVDMFLPQYTLKISAAAFQLGKLFDRDEYPEEDKVRSKFSFGISFIPVPQSGDFRVDIQAEEVAELRRQYDEMYEYNIQKVNRDAWDRLYDTLTQLSFGLRTNDDGTKGKIYDSVYSSASELCELLRHLNINNDTQLEDMRQRLEDTIMGIDTKDIKQSDFMRSQIKKDVDAMLDKWND